EDIAQAEENQWFDIRISGLPYIVEQIRLNLREDMKKFTLGAIGLCGIMLFVVFRSALLTIGSVLACLTAAMLTLVIQSFMGVPIGILTANLGAIVFVLTQTHVIFLVANWCAAEREKGESGEARLRETVGHTFPASFWAAATTMLGFASLIFVDAKPLNQLGVGGAVGTVAALICAYTVFPAFLRMTKVKPANFTYAFARQFPLGKKVAMVLTLVVLTAAAGVGYAGISRLDTDPSLLSYFKDDTKLHNGIYYVDRNGGSNPLTLVVKRKDGGQLDNRDSYEQMWSLQNALSAQDSVGSVISLPVLMAEGNEDWIGKLLPWNVLVDFLFKPEYGAVARSFLSEDRTQAVFILRMKENGRTRDRLDVIKEISAIPGQHGFTLLNTGGTYYLQGELADAVAKSMTVNVLSLIAMFGVIGFVVSGTVMAALAVMVCAACIAAIVVGTLGLLRVPVDIISSPAMNICLGLIVDDMIHLTVAAKREAKKAGTRGLKEWAGWKAALDVQSWPAIISTLTVMVGFAVFALSGFPPSQRFGLEIVYGAAIAVILALGVFPYLAMRRILFWRARPSSQSTSSEPAL
ncbi:MAG: MMPL family transporter, partial [Alphaproteobacteria bacterium]|nr:MMPL family transporter [Alphaproteobacteria bacterium]